MSLRMSLPAQSDGHHNRAALNLLCLVLLRRQVEHAQEAIAAAAVAAASAAAATADATAAATAAAAAADALKQLRDKAIASTVTILSVILHDYDTDAYGAL